ncbi:MAG: haloacid dehalogenase, partial [Candidatus Protistobacter heckmanni]|nr:haloacid dehalogenase [Candidatus Protistobacter heckmanni]
VSSNAWDALCAGWFGYTVFWVNRQGLPFEELGEAPHHTASSLTGVLDLVLKQHSN